VTKPSRCKHSSTASVAPLGNGDQLVNCLLARALTSASARRDVILLADTTDFDDARWLVGTDDVTKKT